MNWNAVNVPDLVLPSTSPDRASIDHHSTLSRDTPLERLHACIRSTGYMRLANKKARIGVGLQGVCGADAGAEMPVRA